MKRLLLSILASLVLPGFLFSLDLLINDEDKRYYGLEELREFAVEDETIGTGSLLLSHITPLFEDVYQIEAYSGRNKITLEEPEGIWDSLSLVFTKDGFYLSRGDYRFENPQRIDIRGELSQERELTALLPKDDDFTRERLELFCHYRGLTFTPLFADNPARELANRVLQQKSLPHIVLYSEEQASSAAPYISDRIDYAFSLTALFSKGRVYKQPMDLDEILAESVHTYSWNSYDYPVLNLFVNYYDSQSSSRDESLRKALILQRTLKEMGILKVDAPRESVDFFLASTDEINVADHICYPAFIPPLRTYTYAARTKDREKTVLTEKALEFLLSENTQRLLGQRLNGFYPAVNTVEYTIPSDPCALVLNRYQTDFLRLNYDDDITAIKDNWLTLIRLALNSSHSLDDLIFTTNQQIKENTYE